MSWSTAAAGTTWETRVVSCVPRWTSPSTTRSMALTCAPGWRVESGRLERTTMRSVDEQLTRVLGAAVRSSPVRVAISEAQGLLCAEEVVAERALPGFDQAAVDGYAVRSVDVQPA